MNIQELLDNMSLEEKVILTSTKGNWRTNVNYRLNIPDIIMTDGTYGVTFDLDQIEKEDSSGIDVFSYLDVVNQNSDASDITAIYQKSHPATCFPNGATVACSWDTKLLKEMGIALGQECQDMGIGVLLGPGINIRRTPLGGRGYEYYSEDPVLSGDLAASIIEGVQSEGIGTCLKHFVCNNSEIQRTNMDSIVDERALREIYLYGFERAIKKGQPYCVMTSYNKINGIQAAENPLLINDILRAEWGFNGVVVSDWGGVKDRPASILAGNDLNLPEESINNEKLLEAVKSGIVPVKILDESCTRILKMIFRIREDEKDDFNADFTANADLARRIASESIVLLKNDDTTLPITPGKYKKIAVLGEMATKPVIQGLGCATTVPTKIEIPLHEIKHNAGNDIEVMYSPGYSSDDLNDESHLSKAIETAKLADLCIIFVNTEVGVDGEGADRTDLDLITIHRTLITEVVKVNSNCVVILANSDSIIMPWLKDVKAVLETFFAGQAMGGAVADLLFGKVNPSGKLTVTMPYRVEDNPTFLHYPGENYRHLYSEGIYVGYRYYDKKRIKPLFPFGFGLSYTHFEYSNLEIDNREVIDTDPINITMTVTNHGIYSGKEIVQLYIKPEQSRLPRPERELKAFSKINLSSGESKKVQFELSYRDFAYYDPSFNSWIVESGTYQILVGKSSRDIELKETIYMKASREYFPKVDKDTTFTEILKIPSAVDELSKVLKKTLDMDDEKVRYMLNDTTTSFLGLYKTLLYYTDKFKDDEIFKGLLDRMNGHTGV